MSLWCHCAQNGHSVLHVLAAAKNSLPFTKAILRVGAKLNALIVEFHNVEENLGTIIDFASKMSKRFFISYVNVNNYIFACASKARYG